MIIELFSAQKYFQGPAVLTENDMRLWVQAALARTDANGIDAFEKLVVVRCA